MAWLVYDILAVMIILVCIFATIHRGFIAAIIGFITLAVSMFLSYMVSGWLAPMVYNKWFMESVHEKLSSGETGVFAGFLSLVEGAGFAQIDETGIAVVRFFMIIFFFVLFFLLLRFLTKAFRKVNKVPILGPINKALGAVLGLVIGVFVCLVAATVIALYIDASGNVNSVLNTAVIDSTYVFKPIYRFNLLNFI